MNNRQQKQLLSWSEWYFEVLGNATATQKRVLKANTNTLYTFYKSGKQPNEVISYIVGGCL